MGFAKSEMMNGYEDDFNQQMVDDLVHGNVEVSWSHWESGFIEDALTNSTNQPVSFDSLSAGQQRKVSELYDKFQQAAEFERYGD
jgi:hypothetical protein